MQQTIPVNDAFISSYVGASPSVGPFQIDFPFFSVNDVSVYIIDDATSTARLLVRGADYYLDAVSTEDGSFSSGTVALVLPVVYATVTRTRNTPVERLSNFPLQGFFSRLALNAELNRITVWLQERKSADIGLFGHALQTPFTDGETLNKIAAPIDQRRGKVLTWDGLGNFSHSNLTLAEIETGAGVPGTPSDTIAGYLYGLGMANVGGTGISIDFGRCQGSAFELIVNPAIMTKQTPAAWAPGHNAGGVAVTPFVASTWYHVFAGRLASGAFDAFFDTSATGANKPAAFTSIRRIGSMASNPGGAWSNFVQAEDWFEWRAPSASWSLIDPGTAVVYRAVHAPHSIRTMVRLAVGIFTTNTTNNSDVCIGNVNAGYLLPNVTPVRNAAAATSGARAVIEVMTDLQSQVATQVQTYSGTDVTFNGYTIGYFDSRGKSNP